MELDFHSTDYDNFYCQMIFNSQMTDFSLKSRCQLYLIKNLIKKPNCFKNPGNTKTIDLVLTKRPKSFCNSDSIETGL